VQPDEIYNLAAHEPRGGQLREPEYTANADGIGTLRLLEAIRILGWKRRPASTRPAPQRALRPGAGNPAEGNHALLPAQPLRVAKLYAYWITVNYREAYGIYACNGILFNHESPLRGETFVTRKITRAMARIALGLQDCLYLGNLDALRDWGHARDYVEMQWLMLQQDQPRTSSSPPACNTACAVRRVRRAELGIDGRRRQGGDEWASSPPCATGTRRQAGRRHRQGRPALLPPHRSRNPARRPDQGRKSSAGRRRPASPNWCRNGRKADYTSAKRDALVKLAGFQAYDHHE
jgi:GDPmannose 4,6-dehydratase